MRSVRSTLVLLATLALLPAPVLAQSEPPAAAELLQQARAREAALDFQGALGLVRKALARGGAAADLTWQLYAAQGELSSVVGLAEEATMAFSRALNLHPTFDLPPDASPRMVGPYQQAKAALAGARLLGVPSSERLANGRVQTRLRIEGDVLQLVAGARLLPRGGQPLELTRTDTLLAYWACDRDPCAYTLSVFDARGNELLAIGTQSAPLLLVELAVPAPVVITDDRPWYRRGWPYLVAATVSAAAGTVFAIRCAQVEGAFKAARDDAATHTYPQVTALDAERRGYWGGALASFVLALGFGALSVIWW
jgi:tetratricopeptide (TPR) repeat protein